MNTRKDIGQPLVSDSASGAQPQHSMDALKKYEWMLSAPPTLNQTSSPPHHDQDYGDLTALNRDGLILKTIGRKNLENIASDYLELLGTASAIYEKNGDYAFGIFSSGWCKMMDSASRSLCQTADNAEALDSGRWLCHESCWTDCSKKAISDGVPVDIACNGGIRIYSVPILAHGDVIGSIKFGYGDPPTDPEALQALADRFNLECEDLARMANTYKSRPPFIVELAKKRLHATARLIGSLIETKQAEKAMVEQKEMLTAIFRNAPLMIMLVDSKRRIRQLNRGAMQFAGRIEKEMVDLRAGEALRCIHALEAPGGCGFGDTCQHCVIRNTVLDTLETGNTYLQIEAPYCSKKPGKEAKKFFFFMSSAPVEIKGEQMALVTLQDITEQKKAQSAMQKSAARFKRLLANLPMLAVQGYQPDGTAIYWNKGSENLYGYEAEEALGRNLLDLIIPEDMRDLVKQNVKQMVENVTPAPPEELNLMRKDGTLVPVLSCHMILKHEDKLPELFCFDLDLSKTKNSEKERLDLEKNLAQAQKMESVGRLAGGVAHDFNNMLMGIMGYADLCREELDKEHPLQEWLKEITKEAKRSGNLTRQLLAFARKQTIKPKTLNLNESIENMLKMQED